MSGQPSGATCSLPARWLGMRLGLAAVLTLMLAWPAAAQACGPKSATTVKSNSFVRVYYVTKHDERHYRACSKPDGRPIAVGDNGRDTLPPDHIRLARHRVAYSDARYSRYFSPTVRWIHLLNVRRRRVTRTLSFIGREPYATLYMSDIALHGLRLKRNGSMSFLVGPVAREESFDYQVWIADTDGSRAVASGAEIEADSFRATVTRVSWIDGGHPRFAPFH